MEKEIEQNDCDECYREYQLNKSFNRNCPIYKENLELSDDYVKKCVWIKVRETELRT